MSTPRCINGVRDISNIWKRCIALLDCDEREVSAKSAIPRATILAQE